MIILCADDYALTEGVSHGIGELASAGRLSATSALATSPHWPAMAALLRPQRAHLSIGLHLNLTLGAPLGPMPRLAPDGRFPALARVLALSLSGRLPRAEVGAEIERQLDGFESALGFPPDHIDGHQHVHVLPGVRAALLDIVMRRYGGAPPLLRDPSASLRSIDAGGAGLKALLVRGLAIGFAAHARRRGAPVNDGFSGFSRFDPARPYAAEFAGALRGVGRRHIVMCHPGHADAELAALDDVAARRDDEYKTLAEAPFTDVIWRPSRSADGPPLIWAR